MKHDVQHRQDWFAQIVDERVVPLLQRAADQATQHGSTAECLKKTDEIGPAAELIISPPGLPARAQPPRLTIRPAPGGQRPLSIDIAGTFPNAGIEGGFGAEIEYDSVYPDQLDEQILRFLTLALGE
ncbi:MAG: hypothetical protein JO001_19885 [Alphaproteobacteria bacterium]|nr:hypothetical protein [Alphaproteobacteria bacterium]